MEKGIVRLSDLVSNKSYRYQDKFYLGLNKKYKKEFFKILLKEFKTIKNLEKITSIKFTRLWDQLTRTSISLEVLAKLSKCLENKGYKNYSLIEIEKNINYIKSGGATSQLISNPKFPLQFETKQGMRFLAHLYHDGGISTKNKQPGFTKKC